MKARPVVDYGGHKAAPHDLGLICVDLCSSVVREDPPSGILLTLGGGGGIAEIPMSARNTIICSQWSIAGAMFGRDLDVIGVNPRPRHTR